MGQIVFHIEGNAIGILCRLFYLIDVRVEVILNFIFPMQFYSRSVANAGQMLSFHTTVPKMEEKEAAELNPAVEKGPGTEWFALPVGLAFAIPAIGLEWFPMNEETQLMACFVAFCVTAYTQGGDAIYKSLDEKAVNLLKEHNEVEDKVINQITGDIEILKNDLGVADMYREINSIRESAYGKLNAVGAVKPKYDLKSHVERVIDIIAAEESSVAEKKKIALMEEATAAVTAEFASSKALKKAALESAIASIKGGDSKTGADPVQAAYVKFFKAKAVEAKKTDAAESKAERDALIAKINSIAKNESLSFNIGADGVPKLASA